MQVIKTIIIIAFVSLIAACQSKTTAKYPTNKLAPNDPFAETMVESKFFAINPKQDNIVEGVYGTVLFIPEGALLDESGKPITGEVKLELAEVLSAESMVLSNLNTTSNGSMLQSGGMLYINATANGQQLHIDTAKPIRIEVPTDTKVEGMMAYRGIRDSLGNMNWIDPLPLISYLTKVNLEDLDFLPEGFFEEVQSGMPYRGHEVADRPLADSLYYSLAVSDGTHLTQGLNGTDMNEAQYNVDKKIINGKYTDGSFDIAKPHSRRDYVPDSSSKSDTTATNCGINPASIKVLKNKKFNNTFIATREFEERMRWIHKTCDQRVIDIYVNNLIKNLWEADKEVFDFLNSESNAAAKEFERFYLLKQTKVKDGDKAAQKLAEYYKDKLTRVENELQGLKNKEIRELEKENKKVEEVKEKYRKVLWDREKYRNERYGWEWTDFGWANIDKPGPIPKCGASIVEVQLTDATRYDRAYIYVLIPSLKSLYRLNTIDNKNFYAGNASLHEAHLPCNQSTTIITVAYKGEQAYFGAGIFIATEQTNFNFPGAINAISKEELKKQLKQHNGDYTSENSIANDLKFQEKFYQEQLRQKTLLKEQDFIWQLRIKAFPCCFASTPAQPSRYL